MFTSLGKYFYFCVRSFSLCSPFSSGKERFKFRALMNIISLDQAGLRERAHLNLKTTALRCAGNRHHFLLGRTATQKVPRRVDKVNEYNTDVTNKSDV